MTQSRIIFIICVNLAKFSYIAQLVDLWKDGLEIACSSPLYATILLLTMFACGHTSLHGETNN